MENETNVKVDEVTVNEESQDMQALESETGYDLTTVTPGVMYLVQGYFDYCKELISNRAIVDLRDGLKPVNRNILITMYRSDKHGKVQKKCGKLASDTMEIHPHGDAAIYQAMTLMTDNNGSLAFPPISGQGAFGRVEDKSSPAAPRYTEARLNDRSDEYFNDIDGVDMIPNFDATQSIPEVLPITFPAVLVNSTSGIAVGFRGNMPSFNFNDVCDLVKEYITDGHCHTVIKPDFVMGGQYVNNERELQKLMQTGKGKIKLRGTYTVDGRDINITSIPFSKKVQGIIKQINDREIPSISNAYDSQDFEHGILMTIQCKAKSRVDEALYTLIKDTDFQFTYNADMTVIDGGVPKTLGVWSIIEKWVKWRREVVTKKYQVWLDGAENSIQESEAIMNLIKDKTRVNQLVNVIQQNGKSAGMDFIRKNYTETEIHPDLVEFCATRSITVYHDGGKYAKQYSDILAQKREYEGILADVDAFIVKQMDKLKAIYGITMARRTEVTENDYNFIETEEAQNGAVVKETKSYYALKNNFLRKCNIPIDDKTAEFSFEGTSLNTLIAFDNRGRVLRIYCQDIMPCSPVDMGVYLPRYLGIEADDNYKITWIGLMDGKELMLLYKDGNVGFVNTNEWVGNNRNVRVLEEGIAVVCADKLGYVFTKIPNYLFVRADNGDCSWSCIDNVKHKHRKAKTRVFKMKEDTLITDFVDLSDMNYRLSVTTPNFNHYANIMRRVKDTSDIIIPEEDFVKTYI